MAAYKGKTRQTVLHLIYVKEIFQGQNYKSPRTLKRFDKIMIKKFLKKLKEKFQIFERILAYEIKKID